MAITEVSISGSFLSEVKWARDTILRINEAKVRDQPIGLDATTHQPDALFAAFARRDLLFYPYIRRPGFAVGSSEAYVANIATLHYYIERERREELQSVNTQIQALAAAGAQGHNVGLLSPGGNLDEFAAYFAIRGLRIEPYNRGKFSVGEPSADDDNIAVLQSYLAQLNSASAR